jgi:hypothetical protein
VSITLNERRPTNSEKAQREQNLINPSGSVPLYSSREIEVIEEEPEEE